jgi:hypothetical protein
MLQPFWIQIQLNRSHIAVEICHGRVLPEGFPVFRQASPELEGANRAGESCRACSCTFGKSDFEREIYDINGVNLGNTALPIIVLHRVLKIITPFSAIIMTTPQLSMPVVVLPADLKSNPELTSQITSLTNDAFARSQKPDPEKWNHAPGRFPTHESYYKMLVDGTIVALIFDRVAEYQEDEKPGEADLNGKVVACAAAVPWKGGWAKEGAGEEGWEIKALAVDGDLRYLHKGLAVQVMTSLENRLIEQAKRQLQKNSSNGTKSEKTDKRGCLTLWILAAECINGAYWRKRGYREVRRTTEGVGVWDCKTSFELVVFRRDIEYDVLE